VILALPIIPTFHHSMMPDLTGFPMDFNLTKEQTDIQKAAREFAAGEFDPDRILEWDRNQEFPVSVWKKACNLGFQGVHFPEGYGGQGLELLNHALIIEAFCRQDSGVGMALALSDFGAEMVLAHGTDEQKKKVLPSLAQGQGWLTLAFLEEGYDLSTFRTICHKHESGYTIQGKKSYVTLAGMAQSLVVVCQADSGDSAGQSVFLLKRDAKGIERENMGEKLGMRMIPMQSISFQQVVATGSHLVGQEGKGSSYLGEFLNTARVEAGAAGVGIAQGAFDRALDYARKREQFGKAIVTFDPIKNKLADMLVRVEMARGMVYRAACCLDQKRPENRWNILAKMTASKAALEVANDAIQIHGGYGYMTEGQVEHFYRDARALDLFLESGSIEKSMLADQIAGRS
jgi:alkylation response protein AidB-like acyl-CoA dehydrogenase